MTQAVSGGIGELRAAMDGPVIAPDDSDFDERRRVFNAEIDRRPPVIARCASAADVVAAISFARRHRLEISVRGGAHNTAGTAVCDDGLIVAQDADRVFELSMVHSVAALVPALRGDWELASAHVQMATAAAQAAGTVEAITAAAIARAFLAMARDDLEGVADAAAAVRATGKAELVSFLARYDWRFLEIGALIGLARLGQAETALAELEADLSPVGPPSALVAAARLRGDLATAAGHQAAAAAAFETAWRRAQGGGAEHPAGGQIAQDGVQVGADPLRLHAEGVGEFRYRPGLAGAQRRLHDGRGGGVEGGHGAVEVDDARGAVLDHDQQNLGCQPVRRARPGRALGGGQHGADHRSPPLSWEAADGEGRMPDTGPPGAGPAVSAGWQARCGTRVIVWPARGSHAARVAAAGRWAAVAVAARSCSSACPAAAAEGVRPTAGPPSNWWTRRPALCCRSAMAV